MAKQHKTSTGALLAIVAVVALLLVYIMMENGGEPLETVSTTPTTMSDEPALSDEPTEEIGAPEEDSIGAPVPAPAPAASVEDVDAALAEFDAALEQEEYDASSVTELFEEDATSELTQPYEL